LLTWAILAVFGLPLYYLIKQQVALKAARKQELKELSDKIKERQRASIAAKRKKILEKPVPNTNEKTTN